MNCQRRWPGTTPDMQTKFMLLFFGHKYLPFSLTWQVSLTCKSEFLREIKEKKNVLDCMKLEFYKEVLNFSNIEYHIIFLITQIPGQQYHVGDSLGTRVLFRTQFCRTQVLKKWYITKYFWNNASLPQILPKRGIWLFSPDKTITRWPREAQ